MPKIRINYTRCPKCGGDGGLYQNLPHGSTDGTYYRRCTFCYGTGRAPMEVIKVKENKDA